MDEPEVGEYVENHGLEKLTDRTVDKRRELLEDLTAIRQRGYALDMEELVPGVCCVAAPVSDCSNRVVGALGISVLSGRFRRHDDRLISRTVASCHAATEALESAGLTLPNLGAKLAAAT
jgi:DNA-binding IclR family transcriptional regulator